jgi:hypothetical protein
VTTARHLATNLPIANPQAKKSEKFYWAYVSVKFALVEKSIQDNEPVCFKKNYL